MQLIYVWRRIDQQETRSEIAILSERSVIFGTIQILLCLGLFWGVWTVPYGFKLPKIAFSKWYSNALISIIWFISRYPTSLDAAVRARHGRFSSAWWFNQWERERERRFVISFPSSTISVSISKIRSHDENVMTRITACDHLPHGLRVTMFR